MWNKLLNVSISIGNRPIDQELGTIFETFLSSRLMKNLNK